MFKQTFSHKLLSGFKWLLKVLLLYVIIKDGECEVKRLLNLYDLLILFKP